MSQVGSNVIFRNKWSDGRGRVPVPPRPPESHGSRCPSTGPSSAPDTWTDIMKFGHAEPTGYSGIHGSLDVRA